MLGHDFEIGSKNEKKIDTKKPMTIKHSAQYYLDIMENLHRGLYLGTGHRLTQGELRYEPTHIDYTEKHRIEMLKELTSTETLNIETNSEILIDALSSMSDLIDREMLEREGKK